MPRTARPGSTTQRRKRRSRPTPRWLVRKTDLDVVSADTTPAAASGPSAIRWCARRGGERRCRADVELHAQRETARARGIRARIAHLLPSLPQLGRRGIEDPTFRRVLVREPVAPQLAALAQRVGIARGVVTTADRLRHLVDHALLRVEDRDGCVGPRHARARAAPAGRSEALAAPPPWACVVEPQAGMPSTSKRRSRIVRRSIAPAIRVEPADLPILASACD